MWPILIQFGRFKLATYGVCVAGGYLLGIYWLKSQMAKIGLDEKRFWSLIYCMFFGAIAGGKLLYVIVDWPRFVSGELHFIRDFRYGFVFYGGFLGGLGMTAAYIAFIGADFFKIADYFGVAIPLGHWLGRIGCLSAGCCYGRPASIPWGIRFTRPDSLVAPTLLGLPLHPTQIYEAAGDLAIAGFIYYAVLRKVEKGELKSGTAFYAYIASYAALRFTVEIFRGDDRGGFWHGLSPSQLIALACLAAIPALMWRRGVWNGKSA